MEGDQIDPHNPPKVENQHSGFIVSVRVKPLDSDEDSAVKPHSVGHIELSKGSGESKIFSYDYVHWSTGQAELDGDSFASQQTVYDDIGAPLVENARSGFNCTLFAFGQTGSGKTHTMLGEAGDGQGLIPRICRQLLSSSSATIDHIVSCKYEVSYVEIYMEKVRDLLEAKPDAGASSSGLRVREHPESGPFVEGCRVEPIEDYEGISRLMALGTKRRRTAATDMNEHSSRSHAIFILTLTQDRVLPGGKKYVVVSKINLVDLAGSENARLAGSTGEQLKEGAAINKSLLTLGRVIKALAAAATANQRAALTRRRSSLQSGDGPPPEESVASPAPKGDLRRSMDSFSSDAGTKGKNARRASVNGPMTSGTRPSGRGQSLGGAGSAIAVPAPLAPPYRDSVLTYLLRDSLGGNSKTTLVATIRPGVSFQEETGVTLTYASQARSIVNIVHVNENPYVAAIKTLQKQVDELKKNLEIANSIIAASAASSRTSDFPPPGRDSLGSVQLASWMEEEDEAENNKVKDGASGKNSLGSDKVSLRSSTPLCDIPEGEENIAEVPVSEAVDYRDGGVVDSTGTGPSEDPQLPERVHSSDSDSESEEDVKAFMEKVTLERADSSDRAMLAGANSENDFEVSELEVPMRDTASETNVQNGTPIRSPLVHPNGLQTWASVSSVNGDGGSPSPMSPVAAPTFGSSGPTPDEIANALGKCGFLLKRGFINTAYKLRYFKVAHSTLLFYKRSSDQQRRGSIFCGGASVDKRRGDALDPGTPYAFTLCTPHDPYHKTWTLQATSERERDDWILVINIIANLPPAQGAQSPGALVRGGTGSSTMTAVGKATCCMS